MVPIEAQDEVIELTTVVKALRSQLTKAVDEAPHEEIRFELGPIELEFSVVVTQEDNVGGKIHFWILGVDGSSKETASSTQRIKLTLQPKSANSTATPWISGPSGEKER
ncbi:trypco2 family protein [Streptosporangium sp. NPDC002524]|uniref:trypco2 family protein n=1 Tax=Streptosporangium sp. NPDC002524 TaxID=3154537 RepID=UPI00331E7325